MLAPSQALGNLCNYYVVLRSTVRTDGRAYGDDDEEHKFKSYTDLTAGQWADIGTYVRKCQLAYRAHSHPRTAIAETPSCFENSRSTVVESQYLVSTGTF